MIHRNISQILATQRSYFLFYVIGSIRQEFFSRKKTNPLRGRYVFVMLSLVFVFLFAGTIHAEHDTGTYTFEFNGTTGNVGNDMQEFIIHHDGAFYVTLKSYTASPSAPTSPTISIGFKGAEPPSSCSGRYVNFIRNPQLGVSYGPYYVQANTYNSYFYLNGGAGTSYSLDIEYRRQLISNDTEENDTPDTAQDIGYITPNSHVYGHLGYLGCEHDKNDYLTFGVNSSGNYDLNLKLDAAFSEKPGCKFNVYLHGNSSLLVNWTESGPSGSNSLGSVDLIVGNDYQLQIKASNCYDTMFEGGGRFVENNKAGGYDFSFASGQAPADSFTVTDVTVKPSVLFPGEHLNGKVFIQNETNSISGEIELLVRVIRLSDATQVGVEQYYFHLSPQQLKTIEFSLKELIAPLAVINLKGGKYKIVALAVTRNSAGQVTTSSQNETGFEINQGGQSIIPILNFLIRDKK